jgi:hypothetical protein
VRFLAFLPYGLLETARIAVAGRHCLVEVDSVSELARALGARGRGAAESRIDALIVDPQGPGRPGAAGLAPVLRGVGDVVVVIYTSLSSAAAHDVVALGLRHVVLHRVDDGAGAFRDLLETAPADTLSAELLAELAPALDGAPPELGRAIREVFYAPESATSVEAFRRAAGMPRMTFERALCRAGFASPRRILWAARALRVFYFLRLHRRRANAVSVRLGYPTPRQMAEEFRRVSGYPPSRLPPAMTRSAFVSAIASGIRG